MVPVLESTRPPAATSQPAPANSRLCLWVALAALAVLWLDLIRQLSYTWSNSQQYAYGWFIPFLALGLFLKKWPSRPSAPDSELSINCCPPPSVFHASSLLSHFLVVAAAGLLLPVRIIHEINQDWPLITWPLTLLVVAFTLYTVYLAGGWPWLRHFALPICFILAAVQWPSTMASLLTQGLMRLDVTLTVEFLGWLDLPALQHGNLIELNTGPVGVDEACSGIRSFQSTLMAAVFLGELYVLRGGVRIGMVLGGLALAFAFNVVRTLLLTYQAASSGPEALEKWHDPAGFSIAVACFFCLWAFVVIVNRTTGVRLQAKGQKQQGEAVHVVPPPKFWFWPFFEA